MIEFVPFAQGNALLNWQAMCDAIEAGHRLPRARIEDSVLRRDDDTLLSRAAWIDGLGLAVKSATVFPGNTARDLPAVNGAMSLFSDSDGSHEAVLDFHLVTKWKTAADSLLAARFLARPDSRNILIVGAGAVARSLRESYGSQYPDAAFHIWSRSSESARRLAGDYPDTQVLTDLESAVRRADIITVATMATSPLIRGKWLQPGQHIDLIGAYRADMRESDDTAMARARVFVDSRDTTLDHIGELIEPLKSGAITRADVVADFYDIASGLFARRTPDEITLFKNGGGAHLDLICARHILEAWKSR